MSAARKEILSRIRNALADLPADDLAGVSSIDRAYRQVSESARKDIVDRFIDRVSEYRARATLVEAKSLRSGIEATLTRAGIRRLVIPRDLPDEWRPEQAELIPDAALSHADLDSADGVLTGCALAIAQTGTIILDGGSGQGRRVLSLLPDYHLCVVLADQIVDLVPEGIDRLEREFRQSRPLTFISGPSATSDIELSRVDGVHGPRRLEVLVVASPAVPPFREP